MTTPNKPLEAAAKLLYPEAWRAPSSLLSGRSLMLDKRGIVEDQAKAMERVGACILAFLEAISPMLVRLSRTKPFYEELKRLAGGE